MCYYNRVHLSINDQRCKNRFCFFFLKSIKNTLNWFISHIKFSRNSSRSIGLRTSLLSKICLFSSTWASQSVCLEPNKWCVTMAFFPFDDSHSYKIPGISWGSWYVSFTRSSSRPKGLCTSLFSKLCLFSNTSTSQSACLERDKWSVTIAFFPYSW